MASLDAIGLGSVQRIAEQLGIAWVESVDLVDDFGC